MPAQVPPPPAPQLGPDSSPPSLPPPRFSPGEEGGKPGWQLAEQGFLPAACLPPSPTQLGSLSLHLSEGSGPGCCQEPPLKRLLASLPWLRDGVTAAQERLWETAALASHLLWLEDDVQAGEQSLVMSSRGQSFL